MIQIRANGKDIPLPKTAKELKRVGDLWVRNARYRLDNFKPFPRKDRGGLRTSMKVVVGVENNSPFVDVTPSAPYWNFIDQGVKGSKSSPYRRQSESPFAFRDKMPPLSAILPWVERKRIQIRDKKGRYSTYRSTAYVISRSIYFKGIAPTHFITDTGEFISNKYGEGIAKAMLEDIADSQKKPKN